MVDAPEEFDPRSSQRDWSDEVGTRAVRKIRARGQSDRTYWFGLGMIGVIGWPVALSALIGVGLGWWLDRVYPSTFSWTLALLLGGVTLGCLNAWHWLNREREAMNRNGSNGNQ